MKYKVGDLIKYDYMVSTQNNNKELTKRRRIGFDMITEYTERTTIDGIKRYYQTDHIAELTEENIIGVYKLEEK